MQGAPWCTGDSPKAQLTTRVQLSKVTDMKRISGSIVALLLAVGLVTALPIGCDFRRAPDSGYTPDSSSPDSGTKDSGETGDTGEGPDTADTALGPQWDCTNRFWHKSDLDISTETTISQFCDTYNAVEGDLTLIFGNADDPILMLDGISCLCEVTGDLELYFLDQTGNDTTADTGNSEEGAKSADDDLLASTTQGRVFGLPLPHASADLELQNLQTVGGTFSVHDVPGVTSIVGVTSLESVGNDLHLETLVGLQIVQFEALHTVGGDIQLLDSPAMQEFLFPALKSTTSLTVGGVASETWHNDLTAVSAPLLESVEGDFAIGGVPALESVSAAALTTVGGAFHVDTTCAYTPDFPALTSVGAFRFLANCATEDFSGLASLQNVTDVVYESSIFVSNNDGITTSEIDSFVMDLSFDENAKLKVHGSESGGCDDWMESKFSRSKVDVCEKR